MNLRKQKFKPFKIYRLSNSSILVSAGQVFVENYGVLDIPEAIFENIEQGRYTIAVEQLWSVSLSPDIIFLETNINGYGRFYKWEYTPISMTYVIGQDQAQTDVIDNILKNTTTYSSEKFYYKIADIYVSNILRINTDDSSTTSSKQWIEIPNLNKFVTLGQLD